MNKGTKHHKETGIRELGSKGIQGNTLYKYKMGVKPIVTFAKHRQTALKYRGTLTAFKQ